MSKRTRTIVLGGRLIGSPLEVVGRGGGCILPPVRQPPHFLHPSMDATTNSHSYMSIFPLHLKIYNICTGSIPTLSATFGQGSGPIHMRSVQCTGDEATLAECTSVAGGTGCSHAYDAGVRCHEQTGI